MGKILLSLALAAAFAIPSFAQDIVILKNGTSIDAKVLEVDDNAVRYKKFNNPDGPTYTAKKETISEIRYKNGSKEIFNQAKATSPDKNPNSVWWTKARETKLGFWMDPLGLAQWGPMVGVVIRMGTNFDIKAHVRYYNEDFPLSDEFHNYYYDQGFGIGLEFSKLFATTHGNWHAGFLFEIATMKAYESYGLDFNFQDKYSRNTDSYGYSNYDYYYNYIYRKLDLPLTQYTFALTGGYTLRFNNRFFIDFSLQSGIALQMVEDIEPLFYTDASLKLGIEL
ncbi:MAG: hypothetical protein SPL52_12315 [Fibrobacter sp.]|nr:hypothetical protein [Fibrobacter sp.]